MIYIYIYIYTETIASTIGAGLDRPPNRPSSRWLVGERRVDHPGGGGGDLFNYSARYSVF